MNNERIDELAKAVYKILDKLEQRIASLEKVLASHAKCIGEMREDKNDNNWNGKRNNQSNKNRKQIAFFKWYGI